MSAKVVKSHRIRFAPAQVTLQVFPPVIVAQDGVIPANTKVYADFYVNGVRRKPDGLGPLFGTTSGAAPDTEEYKSVRWLWNTADPRFGFTVQRGTVLKDSVTRSFVATLDGREYTASVTFSRVASGDKGDPGAPTPPPMMWSDYPEGYEFQDGKTAVDGSPASRLDCVLVLNTASATKDEFPLCYYRCIKSHVKSASKMPKAGSEYWTRASEFSTIATEVILAQNGYIQLLSTQSLKVYKSDGSTVNAAFGGGDWPAWFGAASPSDAPLKISAVGAIYAQEGVFEGSVLQRFRYIDQSDATLSGSGDSKVYTLKSDLNLICSGETVVLPTSLSYAGYRVTLANNIETYSRSDLSTYVRTQDGSNILGFPKPQDTSSGTSLPRPGSVTFPQSGSYATKTLRFISGVVGLIAIPNEAANKCRWYVTSVNAYISDAY